MIQMNDEMKQRLRFSSEKRARTFELSELRALEEGCPEGRHATAQQAAVRFPVAQGQQIP